MGIITQMGRLKLRDSPKVTQLVTGITRIQTQDSLTPEPTTTPHCL